MLRSDHRKIVNSKEKFMLEGGGGTYEGKHRSCFELEMKLCKSLSIAIEPR